MCNSIETQRTYMYVLFLLANTAMKKNCLLSLIINVCATAVSTVCATYSSVFLSSYRNTIFNQSAAYFLWAFSFCCFRRAYAENKHHFYCPFSEAIILENEALLDCIPRSILWCCVSSVFNMQNLILHYNQ